MSTLNFLNHHREYTMKISRILIGIIFLLVHPDSSFCQHERHFHRKRQTLVPVYVYTTHAPPKRVTLEIGEPMNLTCSVTGEPFLNINWHLNSGEVPSKCLSISKNGTGTLICPDIQREDAGAYSCEADNQKDAMILVGTTFLIVNSNGTICPDGQFNDNARTTEECITCFCFGFTKKCTSSKLFIHQLRKRFDRLAVVLVKASLPLEIQDEIDNEIVERVFRSPNGVQIWTYYHENLKGIEIPYFAIPKSYYGPNILNSYGGYLKYTVLYTGNGLPTNAPDVIISGNDTELVHRGEPVTPHYYHDRQVRFSYGYWYKNDMYQNTTATREEIMMVLAKIDYILIKAKYDHSPLMNVKIINIVMDTANTTSTGNEIAYYVERCSCPEGYYGDSCEDRSIQAQLIDPIEPANQQLTSWWKYINHP